MRVFGIALVVLVGLSPGVATAERVAVIATGPCDAPVAVAARAVREAVRHRLDLDVLDEPATALALGAAPTGTLAAAERLTADGRGLLYADDPFGSAKLLAQAIVALQALPPSAQRWADLRTARTTRVWALVNGSQTAEARLEALALLRVSPDYAPDAASFPSSVQSVFREAQAALAGEPTAALAVISEPAGLAVAVNGRELGRTPMSVALPRAEYRIELDLEDGRVLRTSADLDGPLKLELDVTLERSLHPQLGPCVDSIPSPTSLSTLLGVARLATVSRRTTPGGSQLEVQVINGATGKLIREGQFSAVGDALSDADVEAVAKLIARPEPAPSLAAPPASAASAADSTLTLLAPSPTPVLRQASYVTGATAVLALVLLGGFAADAQSTHAALQFHVTPDGRSYAAGSESAVQPLLARARTDSQVEVGAATGAAVLALAAAVLWVASSPPATF